MNLNLEGLYCKNLNFARTERERERERQITSLQSLKKNPTFRISILHQIKEEGAFTYKKIPSL